MSKLKSCKNLKCWKPCKNVSRLVGKKMEKMACSKSTFRLWTWRSLFWNWRFEIIRPKTFLHAAGVSNIRKFWIDTFLRRQRLATHLANRQQFSFSTTNSTKRLHFSTNEHQHKPRFWSEEKLTINTLSFSTFLLKTILLLRKQ